MILLNSKTVRGELGHGKEGQAGMWTWVSLCTTISNHYIVIITNL